MWFHWLVNYQAACTLLVFRLLEATFAIPKCEEDPVILCCEVLDISSLSQCVKVTVIHKIKKEDKEECTARRPNGMSCREPDKLYRAAFSFTIVYLSNKVKCQLLAIHSSQSYA